jgi:class 3 adenylate cyclase
MTGSNLIDDILACNQRTALLKVVFADVHAFSKRRSRSQIEVIGAFVSTVREALVRLTCQYEESARARGISLSDDLITIPSGDGAAVVFPFDGFPSIHLDFSKTLMDLVHSLNSSAGCDRFTLHGWCNCHPSLYVSVGVSAGKGVIYRDVNGNYNVAGNAINMASCVRQLAGPRRILFSEEAFLKIIDEVDNPCQNENFRLFECVGIKHGHRINVYQYMEPGCEFIDSSPPRDLALCAHMDRG